MIPIGARTRRLVRGGVLVFATAFVGMLCTAGPLFPWSPVRPGYRVEKFDRATLIQPKDAPSTIDVSHPDSLLAELERRTGLRFRSPVTIVATDDWALFNRGGLLRTATDPIPVLGAALQTGTVVYLSPLVWQPGRDPAAVLRHELTHSLLFQQMPLRRTFALARLDWFEEGLAVHFGNPGDYMDDAEWRRWSSVAAYRFDPWRAAPPAGLDEEMWGPYRLTEYRQFAAFLMHRCGARYPAFRDAVLADPDRHAGAYARHCGEPFTRAVDAFGQAVRAGRWPVHVTEGPR